MEELVKFLGSPEFGSPLYFWIGCVLTLFLIFFPPFGKREGLRLDFKYWKKRVEFQSKKVWVLSILVVITSVLMAAVLANPQAVKERSVRIYGKPVMAVIDISGSMEYKARRRPTAGVMPGGEELSNFEKARGVFNDIQSRDLVVDFGLLLYSTESYIARYFASKNELLKDTLENKEEITFISTGTRTDEALAKARTFFSENIEARDKAIILISDLEGDLEAIIKMAEEMERDLWAGIKIYVIVIEKDRKLAADGGPRLSQIKELKMVGMNDKYGIDQICAEIAAMESSSIREEKILVRKSLIPFLIPPILGLITLCLFLSETRFRKIPLER